MGFQTLVFFSSTLPRTLQTMAPSQATLKRRLRRRRERCRKRVDQVYQHLWDAAQACREEDRIQSDYDGWGGGEWCAYEQFFCGDHSHIIEVTYIRNPRDVNILAFTIDGKGGFTMM